jgi:tetratricopeptide (TPR) repeat protein
VRFRSLGIGWFLLVALALAAGCGGTGGVAAPVGSAAGPPDVPEDPFLTLQQAQRALAAHPEDPEALFGVGVAWQARGETAGAAEGRAYLDSARVAFDTLLDRDPKHVKALVHSGLVLEDLGKPDEALMRYNRATEAAPDDPRPYVNLGSLLYFHFKRTYEAKTALVRALELDPESADARFNLGVLFADATLFREARTEWEKAAAGPDGPAKKLALDNLEKIRPLLAAQDSAAAVAPAAPGRP